MTDMESKLFSKLFLCTFEISLQLVAPSVLCKMKRCETAAQTPQKQRHRLPETNHRIRICREYAHPTSVSWHKVTVAHLLRGQRQLSIGPPDSTGYSFIARKRRRYLIPGTCWGTWYRVRVNETYLAKKWFLFLIFTILITFYYAYSHILKLLFICRKTKRHVWKQKLYQFK